MRKTQWLLILVICGVVGCSGWKITERGGKDQPCFTNGECDAGLTCVAGTCQSKSPDCDANEVSCENTWTRSCQDGAWVRVSDCAIGDKVCEKGVCVKPTTDGDEENEDLDTEDGTTDGDIESEQDDDFDSDTVELVEEDTTDGDIYEGDSDVSELDSTDSDTTEFPPSFVSIKSGSFTMGSPSGELGRWTNETQHSVTLTYDFEMSTHETTQAQWTAAFPGTNPSWFGPNADGADCGSDCPVERVDWYEALEYANKLSIQKGLTPCYVLSGCTGTIGGGCAATEFECWTGTYTCTSVTLNGGATRPQDCQGYRLPTEAEWEYAARAGSTTAFYNGAILHGAEDCGTDANLNEIGWYCGNADSTTHTVDSKSPNAWGLYDMSGNVYEWAWDSYKNDLGSISVFDPTISDPDENRIVRGGDWSVEASRSRSANREYYPSSRRYNRVGFRLVRSLNPSTPGFTHIKAGTFLMGSPSGELGRYTNETQHSVTLTYNFEMKATEVTQAEFTAFAGTNPSYFSATGGGAACGTNCPVERVNWYEAAAYANWLSTQKGLTPCYQLTNCTGTLGGGCASGTNSCISGTYSCTVALNGGLTKPQDCQGFRLPTEAEWEYSARAGTTTAFYNGGITYTDCTVDANLNEIGWYCGNASSTTHPGGGKTPNAWGLYDMSGNVWEWAWNWYQASYESDVGTNPVGPASGSSRGARGGSWNSGAQIERAARHGDFDPGYRIYALGFRLVRSLNPSTPGFTHIGAGTFTMGSPSGELGRQTNETQHDVTLTYNFEMKTTEVTQAEWTAAFPGTNPSWFGPNADGADCGSNCPVERVNWYETLAYANWLSVQRGLMPCYVLSGCSGVLGNGCLPNEPNCTSGAFTCTSVTLTGGASKPQKCLGYRLPTEAEWEYAARAGSSAAFYNGAILHGTIDCGDDANLDEIGWYCGNANSTTHAIGGKLPNAWALYDMSGNVHEWVWDWSGEYSEATTDPTGPSTGLYRIDRGGGWFSGALYARSASRSSVEPSFRSNGLGFRIVRSLP